MPNIWRAPWVNMGGGNVVTGLWLAAERVSSQSLFLAKLPSALVLIAATIPALIMGGLIFGALCAVVAVLALREWIRLAELKLVAEAPHDRMHVALYPGLIGTLATQFLAGAPAALLVLALWAIGWWVAARLRGMPHARLVAAGLVYLGLALIAVMWLRDRPEIGLMLCCFLFAVVWGSDTLALVFGRWIGGPHLFASISPNKTWAGLGGAMLGGACGGGLVAAGFGAPTMMMAVLTGAALGFFGQVGDLVESALKRRSHVKDSGSLIPGHGGILDRIDALMPVILVITLIMLIAPGWLAGGP